MSLIVNIYYTGENGNARRFAEEMTEKGIVDRVRAEEGNERYEYFIPMNDAETVLLIDRWKDQESLDKHHASSMMNEITKLRENYDLHMSVERYISDSEGVPDKDKAFIRK
jgi:quinol monooxygenase YgiN